MAENALHLHFNEWPFVDSSGQNKPVTNNGVIIGSTPELLHINGSGNDSYANPYLAQSITPDSTWEIEIVECNHAIWSSTGYGKVEIRPNNGSQPDVNSSVLVTSNVVNIGTSQTTGKSFTFSTPISLASGTIYWLVFVSTDSGGTPSGTINFRRTGASVYSGGNLAAGVTGNDTPWGVDPTFDMRQLKLHSFPVSGGDFDGSSDLTIDRANVLTPNNENWEVDFLIKHNVLTGQQTYYSQYEDANNRCHLVDLTGLGWGLHFLYRYNGTDLISLSGAGGEITDTNEHHVALSKEGSTFRLFLDGVKVAETTYTFSSSELIDSDIYIGQDGNTANYFNGIINRLRISNTTRYTQDFTPSTSGSYETDEFTQLLINFSSIRDEAEAGLSVWNPTQVTRGNVDTGIRIYRFGNQCGYFPGAQSGFAPYAIQLADHPNWNIGDREFTLDTHVYPLSHFNYAGIIHQNTRWYWYIDSTGKLNWYIEDGPSTFSMQSSGTVPIDEWSHIALTRKTIDTVGTWGEYIGTGAGPFASSNSHWTGALDLYWDGAAWNSYGAAGSLERRPISGGWVVGFRPTKIRVTYTDTVNFELRLYDENVNIIAQQSNYVSGTELDITFVEPHDIKFLTPLGHTSNMIITSIEFLTEYSQIWRMYIKGVRQAQTEQDFTIPNLIGPLWIGRGTSTADLFHGYMDELRLLLGKAVFTDDEFWPYDYPYFSEPVGLRIPTYRRRIHSIKGR